MSRRMKFPGREGGEVSVQLLGEFEGEILLVEHGASMEGYCEHVSSNRGNTALSLSTSTAVWCFLFAVSFEFDCTVSRA